MTTPKGWLNDWEDATDERRAAPPDPNVCFGCGGRGYAAVRETGDGAKIVPCPLCRGVVVDEPFDREHFNAAARRLSAPIPPEPLIFVNAYDPSPVCAECGSVRLEAGACELCGDQGDAS